MPCRLSDGGLEGVVIGRGREVQLVDACQSFAIEKVYVLVRVQRRLRIGRGLVAEVPLATGWFDVIERSEASPLGRNLTDR